LRLVFVTEYFWPEIGGLERSTQRLATHLGALGHDVRLVTRLLPGTSARTRHEGVDVWRYPDDGAAPFTAHAAAEAMFADADAVCLFGVGDDPDAKWWRPVLDARLADHGVRLLKVGTEGDITLRRISPTLYQRLDGVLCQTPGIAVEAQSVGIAADR